MWENVITLCGRHVPDWEKLVKQFLKERDCDSPENATWQSVVKNYVLSEGLNAGVGNLIAEGNESNIMKVFWEMTATRYLILGIVVFPLLMFLQSFVEKGHRKYG